MTVRQFLRRHWITMSAAAVALVIVIAAVLLLRTMPPRSITMATGPEGGAYHEVGKFYRAILARSGVELRLRPTGGALENVALLRDRRSGVDVALLQGGTAGESELGQIESLGTMFYEPLWLFYRTPLHPLDIDRLGGLKVAVGPQGSGSRAVSLDLLKRSGVDREISELLSLPPQIAEQKLLSGEIDAAMMLIAWDSPVVKRLLADPRTELASFQHADAYVALFPYLSKLTVPAGVADLAKKQPTYTSVLVAPKASLVVRKDLHAAIQYLLLNAAVQVHSGPGIFQRAGQFPAAEAIDVPLSDEAQQFYKSGRPFLQNYLPFWMAAWVGRFLVLLIPVLGVLYPLLRFMPAIYDWTMRRKIARLYGELRLLEIEMNAPASKSDAGALATRLDHLEQQANRARIPVTYAGMLYLLRDHIAQVRTQLKQ